MSTSGKRDSGAAWFEKESEKEGLALEESRIEAGGDPEETSLASKGQA
jgi:hypothetical protein